MMPPKAKKTIPMPKAPQQQERQPQLVVVDIDKLQHALNHHYELLQEKPTLRQTLIGLVGASIIGPFASAAQDEGQ